MRKKPDVFIKIFFFASALYLRKVHVLTFHFKQAPFEKNTYLLAFSCRHNTTTPSIPISGMGAFSQSEAF